MDGSVLGPAGKTPADIAKTNKKDQINVLDTKYQKEIELIVDKLAKFKPTKIVIERQPENSKLMILFISLI